MEVKPLVLLPPHVVMSAQIGTAFIKPFVIYLPEWCSHITIDGDGTVWAFDAQPHSSAVESAWVNNVHGQNWLHLAYLNIDIEYWDSCIWEIEIEDYDINKPLRNIHITEGTKL